MYAEGKVEKMKLDMLYITVNTNLKIFLERYEESHDKEIESVREG